MTPINRRETLKKLAAATGAMIALPAWAKEWEPGALAGDYFLPDDQQAILASVADTIIPRGDAVGALSVGVDKFLVKLLDKCYEKEVQENVSSRLMALEVAAKHEHARSFAECSQPERETLLLRLAYSPEKNDQEFFKLIKSETIRGFSTSREVMLSYHHYQIVPGHYHGCVDVKP